MRSLSLLFLPAVLVLFASGAFVPAAEADVLTTKEGLVLEGKVEKLANGWYRVTTEKGDVQMAPRAVADVKYGVEPRAAFLREAAKVDAKDAVGQYRLALQAAEAGLADLSEAAYRRVIAENPDHPAARRALGFERLDGKWVEASTARRGKGLVLYHGRWMLPAEVEAATAGKGTPKVAVPADEERTRAMIRTLATGAAPLKRAARLALARTSSPLLLRAALVTLYDSDVNVRAASARVLAELGDESALRTLILSGARDKESAVRREAVLAAGSFGHDDTAIPFVRALGSKNPRIAANAAEALALLGDQRAAGYIVKRLRSHGSSTRNMVSFLTQVSYVRDYDVEIAQASNIANPNIGMLQEGAILDVKVVGASYTKTWIEPILVKAFSELVGEPLRSRAEVDAWYAENRHRLPRFPEKPRTRAPRRIKGKVIGLPGQ